MASEQLRTIQTGTAASFDLEAQSWNSMYRFDHWKATLGQVFIHTIPFNQ